ncbi:MAG: SdpI family protein [Bacteroidota bacterium]
MKKFNTLDGAAIIIWILPFIYLYSIYNALPAIVPMHYGANGQPNGYGSRQSFLMAELLVQGVGALMYLLMRFLPSIDPKKQAKYGEAVYSKLALGVLLFLTALSILIIYATQHRGLKIDKILFPLMGLLFAFLGNMMNNIKPNYFAGIRTPWTLEDEDTWRATHRLAAKVWFIGGIAITVFTLLLTGTISSILFPAAVAVMVVVPVIYSYIYYKKHRPA